MNLRSTSRPARRLRLVAALAVPLLALTTACGGDSGADKDDRIASVPDEPKGKGPSGDGTPSSSSSSSESSADGSGSQGKGAFYDAQMKYVLCMRTKGGVKDFPDPRLSGYLDWPSIDEVVDPNGGGEEYKGGKDGVCFPEMSDAMELEPARDTQKDFESMLAHATCMRENGVSRFTDPTMSGGGVMPGGDPSPASPVIDTESPGYKEAREACRDKLLEGLDGMQ
ncbi:hypothetical protein ACIQNG_04950 [Streptomyces sp. NPDC091377]|uniref:hypothetical protein n=1 Tax=Streptomyces sp. NPDC091377 TaxID=3365995 RepID=UPI00381F84D4